MVKLHEFIQYTHYSGDYVQAHSHDMYELILYSGGEGKIIFEEEEVPYSDRTLCIIPRGMMHFERTFSETIVLACVFDTDYLQVQTPLVFKGEKCKKTLDLLYQELEKMKLTISNEELVVGTHEADKKMEPIIYILSYLLLLWQEDELEGKNIINNAKRYLRLNYKRKINYEFLAESVGYSYDRFRHLFKNEVGVSMKQYQTGIRMSRAKVMLQDTGQSVQEIAKFCGYTTTERFIHAFKKDTGIPPLAYRKMSRNNAVNRVFNIQR